MTPDYKNPWDYFDRLYCISLKERPDRRERAALEFSRMGILERVEFILVKKHPLDACRGIFESHLICMKKALADKAENLVIFEDDVVFHRYDNHALSRSIDYLSANRSWTILFFGCLIRGSSKTECPGTNRIQYHALTHAYAVNRTYAKRIIQHPWTGIPYDLVLRKLDDGFLGTAPFFAFQSNASTDNDACRSLDRIRRCFGGLRVIQLMNELYHSHRISIILGHLLIIGLLAVWLW